MYAVSIGTFLPITHQPHSMSQKCPKKYMHFDPWDPVWVFPVLLFKEACKPFRVELCAGDKPHCTVKPTEIKGDYSMMKAEIKKKEERKETQSPKFVT